MQNLDKSITKLNKVIEKKLNALGEKTSVKELKDLNSFISESNNLRMAVHLMGCPIEMVYDDEPREESNFVISGGGQEVDYIEILVQACELIGQYSILIDPKKVKDTKSEWVIDDAYSFIDGIREMFGQRIPAMPGSLASRGLEINERE